MSGRLSLLDLKFSQILRHKIYMLRMSNVLLFKLYNYAFKCQISISYDLIIAAFSNFNRSLKGAVKYSGMTFVTIGSQHHSKTAILRLCTRVVRVQTCALTLTWLIPCSIKFPFEWVVDHLCATYGFFKHFDTNLIYISIYLSTIYLYIVVPTQVDKNAR